MAHNGIYACTINNIFYNDLLGSLGIKLQDRTQ